MKRSDYKVACGTIVIIMVVLLLSTSILLPACPIPTEASDFDNNTGENDEFSGKMEIPGENPLLVSGEKGSKSLIRLMAGYSDDSISYDPFVIYYESQATYSFDGQFDALKLFNTDSNVTNFYLFGYDSSMLSINGIPFPEDEKSVFRLGLKTEKDGAVSFILKDVIEEFLNKTITLTDNVTGVSQVLQTGTSYSVYLPAGDYGNRFFLSISDLYTAIPTVDPESDPLMVYSSHGTITADIVIAPGSKGIITVCSVTGQVIYSGGINDSGRYEFSPSASDGIYIVTMVSEKERISKKLFFRSH